MAKLPDVQSLGPRPIPRLRRPAPNFATANQGHALAADVFARSAAQEGSGLIAFGESLGRVGARLEEAEARRRDAAEKIALAGARSQRDAAIIEAQSAFQNDPDYSTFVPRYLETVEKSLEDLAGTLSPTNRALFEAESVDDVMRGRVQVAQQAFTKQKDATTAWLDRLADQYVDPTADTETRVKGIRDYRDAVISARDLGLISGVDAGDRLRLFAVRSRAASVSEWFRTQPDQYAAAQVLYDNDISDPQMAAIWESMPVDEKSEALRSVIDDVSKLLTFKNQRREEEERIESEAALTKVKDFFFDEQIGDVERASIFYNVLQSPHVSVGTLQAMEAYVREGGRMQDVELHVLVAESEIRRGVIRSESDLVERLGLEGWSISFGTMRTRLMPMIEAQRDDAFLEALRMGQARLGIPSGTSILGAFFQDPVDKSAQFETMLREYKKTNPDGDYWAFAQKILPGIEAQANQGAQKALPVLVQAYEKAKSQGDPDSISNARIALITIMIEAGMITALEGARPSFDPMTIINAPQGDQPSAP